MERFVIWSASAAVAVQSRPDPPTVPLRLVLHDPDTLTIVGQVAIAADDEPTSRAHRWWYLLDDGDRPIRTASSDLTTALHEATVGVEVDFLARHSSLLQAAHQCAIANVAHSIARTALDAQLSVTRPGVVPAVRAMRLVTLWTPAQVSAAIRRHYSRARPLIDALYDDPA